MPKRLITPRMLGRAADKVCDQPKIKFDKVHRMDVLQEAWKQVRMSKGAGGIDKITLEDEESYGVQRFLEEISQTLKSGSYSLSPASV